MTRHKITILSDRDSWINLYIPTLIDKLKTCGDDVLWVHSADEISEGDFVFYLGCGQLVKSHTLLKNKHNLVVHESDLPKGKGWSPLTWQILENKNDIPICLFEAEESVDSGKVYLRDSMKFKGTELIDELRRLQAETSIRMCLTFVDNYPDIVNNGVTQKGEATYYAKRSPIDSQLDTNKTIMEQFNLLRVCDNERYPAFFTIDGETYVLKIEKRT